MHHHTTSSTTIHMHPSSSTITHHHLPWSIINHNHNLHPSSSTIIHNHPSSSISVHNHLLSAYCNNFRFACARMYIILYLFSFDSSIHQVSLPYNGCQSQYRTVKWYCLTLIYICSLIALNIIIIYYHQISSISIYHHRINVLQLHQQHSESPQTTARTKQKQNHYVYPETWNSVLHYEK